jgi:hypothetical protein
MGYLDKEQAALRAAIAVCSRPILTPSDTRRKLALMQFSRFSVMLTEHYRRLIADYLCLGFYCRYTMMTARERKPKSVS